MTQVIGGGIVREVRKHNELVSAIARNEVPTRATDHLEHSRHDYESVVALHMAEGIVDALELVQVHDELVEPLARDILLEPRTEVYAGLVPVVEACQRVERYHLALDFEENDDKPEGRSRAEYRFSRELRLQELRSERKEPERRNRIKLVLVHHASLALDGKDRHQQRIHQVDEHNGDLDKEPVSAMVMVRRVDRKIPARPDGDYRKHHLDRHRQSEEHLDNRPRIAFSTPCKEQ